ncbi:iron-sulfur cluster assembly scaffold protein [bacterium]|nr:iron-sulfur cluster assembly scaffold protein [bacterium]
MKNEIEKIFQNVQNYLMGESSEPYSDKVLTYAYEPVNIGEMTSPDGKGHVKGNCGDELMIWIKLKKGIISNATFLSEGCGTGVACGCAVTEMVKGKTPYEASKITPQDILFFLDGLPVSHMHCAVLAIQALQKALDDIQVVTIKKGGSQCQEETEQDPREWVQ